MNAFAERIIFWTICLQIGIIITNSTEIIPGITLNTGQVNNAYNGGFGTASIMAWFGTTVTAINHAISTASYILLNFGPITPTPSLIPFEIASNALLYFSKIYNLVVQAVILVINLILAALLLLAIILGIFYGVIFGTIQFWTNIISVIDPNPATSALWGGLIGSLQIIIIIYGIGTELLEILGSKGKSLATGGSAGQ